MLDLTAPEVSERLPRTGKASTAKASTSASSMAAPIDQPVGVWDAGQLRQREQRDDVIVAGMLLGDEEP